MCIVGVQQCFFCVQLYGFSIICKYFLICHFLLSEYNCSIIPLSMEKDIREQTQIKKMRTKKERVIESLSESEILKIE